jgi:hypothetical protein
VGREGTEKRGGRKGERKGEGRGRGDGGKSGNGGDVREREKGKGEMGRM